MKNFRLLFIMMAAVMFAVSCTEEDASVDDLTAKKALAMSETDWSSIDFCGPVRYHNLIGGQTILMGSVAMGNDGTNLYVKYQADPGYVITETHLFVGDVNSKQFPTAGKNKNPKIGHFPFKWENHEGSEVVIHTIPLSKIKGDCFDVAAHAVVECEDGTCEETAWGAGGNPEDIVISAKVFYDIEGSEFQAFGYFEQGVLFTENCYWGPTNTYLPFDAKKLPMVYEVTNQGRYFGNLTIEIEDDHVVFTFDDRVIFSLDRPSLYVGTINELFNLYLEDGCVNYEMFPYQGSVIKIPLASLQGSEGSEGEKFDSSRWGFYFNYCLATCN